VLAGARWVAFSSFVPQMSMAPAEVVGCRISLRGAAASYSGLRAAVGF